MEVFIACLATLIVMGLINVFILLAYTRLKSISPMHIANRLSATKRLPFIFVSILANLLCILAIIFVNVLALSENPHDYQSVQSLILKNTISLLTLLPFVTIFFYSRFYNMFVAFREAINPAESTSIIKDLENFCLYLRPFTTDKERTSSDNKLLNSLKKHIQPYAIGNPGMVLQNCAARRIYATHEEWKEAIDTLVKKAPFILIHIGYTEGCLWEFERCTMPDALKKTIFLIKAKKDLDLIGTKIDVSEIKGTFCDGINYILYFSKITQSWTLTSIEVGFRSISFSIKTNFIETKEQRNEFSLKNLLNTITQFSLKSAFWGLLLGIAPINHYMKYMNIPSSFRRSIFLSIVIVCLLVICFFGMSIVSTLIIPILCFFIWALMPAFTRLIPASYENQKINEYNNFLKLYAIAYLLPYILLLYNLYKVYTDTDYLYDIYYITRCCFIAITPKLLYHTEPNLALGLLYITTTPIACMLYLHFKTVLHNKFPKKVITGYGGISCIIVLISIFFYLFLVIVNNDVTFGNEQIILNNAEFDAY